MSNKINNFFETILHIENRKLQRKVELLEKKVELWDCCTMEYSQENEELFTKIKTIDSQLAGLEKEVE